MSTFILIFPFLWILSKRELKNITLLKKNKKTITKARQSFVVLAAQFIMAMATDQQATQLAAFRSIGMNIASANVQSLTLTSIKLRESEINELGLKSGSRLASNQVLLVVTWTTQCALVKVEGKSASSNKSDVKMEKKNLKKGGQVVPRVSFAESNLNQLNPLGHQ